MSIHKQNSTVTCNFELMLKYLKAGAKLQLNSIQYSFNPKAIKYKYPGPIPGLRMKYSWSYSDKTSALSNYDLRVLDDINTYIVVTPLYLKPLRSKQCTQSEPSLN